MEAEMDSCKIQLCPVLCMTKKSSREGVPETS
ncbi:hypothetical protein T03_14837 [Trichinella britovi]|uniref:Uncharacterized protein n=1 Tax=Trichinella britovi TaxID=45882 RepID=A0A0V1C6G8_TRIBR|nr:hypothetical protein T03_14837 [Trichinella britovi]